MIMTIDGYEETEEENHEERTERHVLLNKKQRIS